MKSVDDFYALHDSIRHGTNPDVKDDGLADSTLRNIRKASRQFFRDGLGVDWADEIHIGAPEESNVTEDDIYTADEVETLFDAAHNPRDKALMATLIATGQRISALLSLRVGDVNLDGATGFIYLNDEAIGLKGAAGKRLLLWATEYVKNWLDVHPCKRDDDAAMFCTVEGQTHTERDSPAEPLSPWGVNQQLRRIGGRAGIDKPVNPHNFRHAAVTRMVREGVPEQQVKWTVGWDPDSTQFDRYTHLQDDEHVAAILDHYDIEDDEHAIGAPELDECPSCHAQLSAWVNPKACPGCGCSLTHSAQAVVEATVTVEEDVQDTALDPTEDLTPEEQEGLQAILDAVDDPATLAAKLAADGDA
jgi:integrase